MSFSRFSCYGGSARLVLLSELERLYQRRSLVDATICQLERYKRERSPSDEITRLATDLSSTISNLKSWRSA